MRPHIHKLGGASLADAAAIRHAVSILAAQPRPIVAVVSAMAGVTDALLDGAAQAAGGDETALVRTAEQLEARHRQVCDALLPPGKARDALRTALSRSFGELQSFAHGLATLKELSAKTSDYIVARGERMSARLMSAALHAHGAKSEYVDAVEVIACDEHFGGASPELQLTARTARRVLGPLLKQGVVPVVPGFIGRTPQGHVATLGRGGSDLSATLLARALGAYDVTLWKDVPGLLTADPRIVPDARVIPQLTPREAAELAYYGAKVLHPRALIPLGDRRIPVRVRPFADPDAAGSEVSQRRTLREYPVKALSSIAQQALVTVSGNGMLGVPGIAARTFAAMHNAGVSVSLISQASSEHSICFSVPEGSADVARAALQRAFQDELRHHEIDGVDLARGMTTIAVVGLGMSGTPGIAARVFESLASGGINLVAIAQGSSELNISFVVQDRDAVAAVRRVHGAFQLNRIGGGGVTRAERADVILLGFGQIGRTLARMIPRAKSGTVKLRIVGVIDRSGHVFEPAGLSPKALTALIRRKEATGAVTGSPKRAAAGSSAMLAALTDMARHALSHPIVVDVTAEHTVSALMFGLSAGMDVVMANKRPLGGPLSDARSLLDLAASQGRRLLHETTVGAGLPIIDTFHKLLESGDRVHRIEGCTSGTIGFLMSELQHGKRFSDAVHKARQLGYTEPDPRDDLSGMDVARKALILARLMGFRGELGDVRVEPLMPDEARAWSREEFLRRLPELDSVWATKLEQAKSRGLVLRYVATATRQRVSVELRAVPSSSPFAGLRGTDNQVVFTTTRYRENPLIITGPGAGPAVTAAGVLNDIRKASG
ncbi:MAG: bifunctional aspartate kinase/homoserine dehydrogenase I [Gemmatimonadaceae bacterium]